jgi:hypothetical protein
MLKRDDQDLLSISEDRQYRVSCICMYMIESCTEARKEKHKAIFTHDASSSLGVCVLR